MMAFNSVKYIETRVLCPEYARTFFRKHNIKKLISTSTDKMIYYTVKLRQLNSVKYLIYIN